MFGEIQSLERANLVALQRRKSGAAPITVVSRADAEYVLNWHHQIHTLEEAHMDPVQNANGSFPYMPGWDGPQTGA